MEILKKDSAVCSVLGHRCRAVIRTDFNIYGLNSISAISGVSSSSPSSLVGSSVIYQSGDTALLPCDVSVPKPRSNDGGGAKGDAAAAAAAADELRLIMWYREDVKSPIYRDLIILMSTLALQEGKSRKIQ